MDMRDMSERLADGVLTAAITVAMLVAAAWWLEAPAADDFTVTIDCRAIIMDPGEFPESVVTECRNKVRFIKGATNLTVV